LETLKKDTDAAATNSNHDRREYWAQRMCSPNHRQY